MKTNAERLEAIPAHVLAMFGEKPVIRAMQLRPERLHVLEQTLTKALELTRAKFPERYTAVTAIPNETLASVLADHVMIGDYLHDGLAMREANKALTGKTTRVALERWLSGGPL